MRDWQSFLVKIQKNSKKIYTYAVNNKKKSIINVSFFLCLLVFISILFPLMRRNIQQSQVTALINPEYPSAKIVIIPYGNLEQTIQENSKGISIYFADLKTTSYNQIEAILSEASNLDSYNHVLYIYPMIYDQAKIRQDYQISKDPSFLYFEKGKEVNRMEMDEQSYLLYLIRNLNNLPMENSKELS